jgi:hypothetical protein
VRGRARHLALDAVIDQALAEMGVVDVGGDGRVVPLIDDQRQREAVQHALDGAALVGRLGLDLQQLADERQGLLRQAESLGDLRPQRQHTCRDVGRLAQQGGELGLGVGQLGADDLVPVADAVALLLQLLLPLLSALDDVAGAVGEPGEGLR